METRTTELSTIKIREYCNAIIDYIEKSEQDPIVIKQDYYQYLTSDQMFYFGRKKIICKTVGQVSFDIERLDNMVLDPSSATGNSLTYLGDLLKVAATELY